LSLAMMERRPWRLIWWVSRKRPGKDGGRSGLTRDVAPHVELD
jgi:hypothetical protein